MNLDQRLSSKAEAQDERMDEQHQRVTVLTADLARKVTEECSNLDEKFIEVCTKLDRKLMDTTGALTERVDQHYRHFGDMCTEIRTTAADAAADLNRQVLDQATALSELERRRRSCPRLLQSH